VPAHQIIIGHSCGSADFDYHMAILKGGSYLGFDRFGLDMLVPDEQRIASLMALLAHDQQRQLVLSHDSVWCTRGQPFPQEILASIDPQVLFNPTHIHDHIIPRLLQAGASQQQIDTMLVENPRRFFSGIAPD
jgi:phosphotriesterase-related protein